MRKRVGLLEKWPLNHLSTTNKDILACLKRELSKNIYQVLLNHPVLNKKLGSYTHVKVSPSLVEALE
jgi:hypothetical protein